MLLEPAAFIGNRGAGQTRQAAGQKTHADPGGVEVERREYAIRAHENLPRGRHDIVPPDGLAHVLLAASATALRRLGQPDEAAAAAPSRRARSLSQLGLDRGGA